MREVHIESLEEFLAEISDAERFHALSKYELRMRKTRMTKHFDDMEKTHRLYRQVCILSTNTIYTEMESRRKAAA